MKRRIIQGVDVDTDELAAGLRRLADGIESGQVHVTDAETGQCVDAYDAARFDLSLSYHATHGFEDVADIIRYATNQYLRFDTQYIDPILSGDKTTTIRYGLQREFVPGQGFDLVGPDGDTFATATVEAYIDIPVRRVCEFSIGDWETGQTDDLVETLRDLYDTDGITADTTVTVVLFSGVEPTEDESQDHV